MAKTRATTLTVTFSDVDGESEQKPPNRRVRSRVSAGPLSTAADRKSVVRRQSSLLRQNQAQLEVHQQKLSKVGRNHFLRSFGKDTLYGYQGVDDVLPQKHEDISEKQRKNLEEFVEKHADEAENKTVIDATKSENADTQLQRAGSSAKPSTDSTWLYQDVLEIRGKDYSIYNGDLRLTLKQKIRSQSAKRRIRRIILLADKEKAEKEKMTEEVNMPTVSSGRKTLRGAPINSLVAIKATTGSGTFDMFLEKKKWLTETRKRNQQLAIEKFYKAATVVRIVCKLLKNLRCNSMAQTPMTAAQKAWHALKHTSEAKDILFNITIFQKGKSQYAYIPEWAKNILSKPPMERSDLDLSQLHAVLKGLKSYDKFTYRIQMAMCRAMTYERFEHGRIILRKGHEGLAFYFIFSGSVFVNVEELLKRSGHVVWHTAVVLHRGDNFGELSLLRKIKRTASIVVKEDIELLVVDRDVFAITCPKIYDKELSDKIRFCKSLNIFQEWNADMLRNICFEAQIQDWKSNKIIVQDSSKETEWMYICMQGKCSIIKALDLTECPPGVFGPKRITFEESYFNVFGKGRRTSSFSSAMVLKKELKETFKQPFSFANKDKKVDETHELENETEREPEDESQHKSKKVESAAAQLAAGQSAAKERIIEVMQLPYSNMPHAKGDSRYFEVDQEKDGDNKDSISYMKSKRKTKNDVDQSQIVLEKRMELNSLTLFELMRLKDASGRLNNDVVYLDIASVQAGDIFDLSEILMPTGRKLMLVSKGAVLLRIKRTDYLRYSTKSTLKCARDVALKTDYPSDEIIYRSYNERCAWENMTRKQLSLTMQQVQAVYVRHNEALKAKYDRKPLKSVRGILTKETEERIRLNSLDGYIDFVCGPNKADNV